MMAVSLAKIIGSPAAQRPRWLAFAAMGLALILLGSRRVQLREAGVLRGATFIPWERIAGYELTPWGVLRMRISGAGWIVFWDVPATMRAQAREVLASHCRGAVELPVG